MPWNGFKLSAQGIALGMHCSGRMRPTGAKAFLFCIFNTCFNIVWRVKQTVSLRWNELLHECNKPFRCMEQVKSANRLRGIISNLTHKKIVKPSRSRTFFCPKTPKSITIYHHLSPHLSPCNHQRFSRLTPKGDRLTDVLGKNGFCVNLGGESVLSSPAVYEFGS